MTSPLTFFRACAILICFALSSLPSFAQERLHILIPGGAGGGWDSTARAFGETLAREGLVENVSYENMSGGGGGRAIAHIIETADRQQDTLMINSSSIILRSLRNVHPQSFRDITPVASLVVDYGAFVVRNDSPYQTWADVLVVFKHDYRKVNIAGGSTLGSTDHVAAAIAFSKSGLDIERLKYIPYNGGSHAMVGLLSGETQLLSTGLSEALSLATQGEVRILAVAAPERLASAPDIPTLIEQGTPAIFANWRGFFAAPGLPQSRRVAFLEQFEELQMSPAWAQLRNARGWTEFYLPDEEFASFLAQQEEEMAQVLREIGLLQ